MDLKLVRNVFTDQSTIGDLFVDGVKICSTLEDVDRGLHQDMPPDVLKSIKVYGQTAIPAGKYRVVWSLSPHFTEKYGHDFYTPELLDVPDYEGIRIHIANRPSEILGCIAVGTTPSTDLILHSGIAFADISKLVKDAIDKGDKVGIEIISDVQPKIST